MTPTVVFLGPGGNRNLVHALSCERSPMPALMPMLLLGTQLTLVADRVPELNVEPGCRSVAGATIKGRDEAACKRDEQDARAKLEQEWGQFNNEQRSHCVRLSTLGGAPSYVELLTCLELAKQSATLPPETTLGTRAPRP